jgi:hypothetical protein
MGRPSGQAQSVCSEEYEMVASLREREPGRRGASAFGSNVTENTGLCDA